MDAGLVGEILRRWEINTVNDKSDFLHLDNFSIY
jgi:hypothetical protein